MADTKYRGEERITPSLVKFRNIEKLNTMEEVRKYLSWDIDVAPLPGEIKWFADDKTSWEEKKQAHLDKLAQEKESKRVMASNPTKVREPNVRFLLDEFLADKEAYHDPMFLAMFQAAMLQRKLPSATLAVYNRLWDKFLEESNG